MTTFFLRGVTNGFRPGHPKKPCAATACQSQSSAMIRTDICAGCSFAASQMSFQGSLWVVALFAGKKPCAATVNSPYFQYKIYTHYFLIFSNNIVKKWKKNATWTRTLGIRALRIKKNPITQFNADLFQEKKYILYLFDSNCKKRGAFFFFFLKFNRCFFEHGKSIC